MKNKEIIIMAVVILAFSSLVWLALSPASKTNQQTAAVSASAKDTLAVSGETSFDFGEISMAKGKVNKAFSIKNTGSDPIMIERIYTSCMCTSASLILGGKRTGPFGMAGHGFVPRVKKELPAGGEAQIEVTFDPTAHGPVGVGPIQRAVTVESSGGDVELEISALVRP